jgi:hypothetical protein
MTVESRGGFKLKFLQLIENDPTDERLGILIVINQGAVATDDAFIKPFIAPD